MLFPGYGCLVLTIAPVRSTKFVFVLRTYAYYGRFCGSDELRIIVRKGRKQAELKPRAQRTVMLNINSHQLDEISPVPHMSAYSGIME